MDLPEGLNRFFERLKQAKNRLLLLDYDGTLSPFVEERQQAYPYSGVEERLEKLVASNTTRVIIVTGRVIEHIKPLLKINLLPEIYGSHGWESLNPDGSYSMRNADPKLTMALQNAREYIADNQFDDYLEEKPVSLAIHFRGVEEDKAVEIKRKILHNWKEIQSQAPLTISEFDGGLELRLPGFDKGSVVKSIMEGYLQPPLTAYLGDDITDEDAFTALPGGAAGILVRPEFRETAASFWIKPPEQLLLFLDLWLENDK